MERGRHHLENDRADWIGWRLLLEVRSVGSVVSSDRTRVTEEECCLICFILVDLSRFVRVSAFGRYDGQWLIRIYPCLVGVLELHKVG